MFQSVCGTRSGCGDFAARAACTAMPRVPWARLGLRATPAHGRPQAAAPVRDLGLAWRSCRRRNRIHAQMRRLQRVASALRVAPLSAETETQPPLVWPGVASARRHAGLRRPPRDRRLRISRPRCAAARPRPRPAALNLILNLICMSMTFRSSQGKRRALVCATRPLVLRLT